MPLVKKTRLLKPKASEEEKQDEVAEENPEADGQAQDGATDEQTPNEAAEEKAVIYTRRRLRSDNRAELAEEDAKFVRYVRDDRKIAVLRTKTGIVEQAAYNENGGVHGTYRFKVDEPSGGE